MIGLHQSAIKLFTQNLILLFLGFVLGIFAYFLFSAFLFAPIILPITSPEDGGEILDSINNAEKSIDIEMYLLTSDDVILALMNAHDRGVQIRIILEKRVMGGDNAEAFAVLRNYGITIRWASKTFTLTHSKILIIDGRRVIVGSHNFSKNALTSNREASILIERTAAVDEFMQLFENDWRIATER